jgi:16S rRNA (cytosine967-C5)-methyltransferase
MIERWLKRFGLEKMERLCEYNNRRPLISIRANRMKTTREFLLNQFEKDGIQATPSTYFDDFILLHQPENLAQSPLFRDGFFAIQDESTAIPCILLSPQKGEVILDLCAAPGGKTCYLAQIAEDESNIIAVDQNPKRLERLQQNIKRLRLKSIRTVVGDGTRFNLRPIDKILLDAPCSGLGVLARRADLRWKRSLHDICKIQELQKSLLASADKMLKPGGTLVYSTCTIEPEENEIVIDDFVSSNKNYVIETTDTKIAETFATKEGFFKSLPQDHNMDGSFAVKLIKKS